MFWSIIKESLEKIDWHGKGVDSQDVDSKAVDSQSVDSKAAITSSVAKTAMPPPLERDQPGLWVGRKRAHKAEM